ncbi:MAG TPA: glycosyl hydrolase [Halococcus sp.]|nr:glycosyl hydrolase [Halococcus sp.]
MVCGIYNDPERMELLCEMECWLGARHAVQTVFTPWNEGAIEGLFERILPAIWDAGRIPLLTWEPYTQPDESTDSPIAARITTGEFDTYLDRWTTRLVEWLAGSDNELKTTDDRRLYLRFAHEMNGDWYPWSPAAEESQTPADYIEMWRYVHDRVMRERIGDDHLQWVWCVNHTDVGAQAEDLYPGDTYVDWVGVDGFNWGASRDWATWRSPRETFSEMFDRLDALTDKPRCVPEFASTARTATGHDPQKKAEWIRDAYQYLDGAGVGMACWFNEDKETDWAVFGGEYGTDSATVDGVPHEAYPTYREAITDIGGVQLQNQTDTMNPARNRVSDAEFFGTS